MEKMKSIQGRTRATNADAQYRLSKADCTQIKTLAAQLIRDEPGLLTSLDFGPYVQQGLADTGKLIIGDESEITLSGAGLNSWLDHRMALLADEGDSVIVRQRIPEFEDYLDKYLNIRGINFFDFPAGEPLSAAVRARTHTPLFAQLSSILGRFEGLIVLAYLTTGNVWRLAQDLGESTKCPVHVCGPSPRLEKRVNDKLWFANRIRDLLGPKALPPTHRAYGPAAAAALVARLATTSETIVLKIPDSAGSLGNVSIHKDQILGLSLPSLQELLVAILHRTGWNDSYPLLVGVWEDQVISSPSVQLWIPALQDGNPVVEGVFEQRVQGAEGTFIGAAKVHFPNAIHQQLIAEAVKIAALFQQIGYFGLCSLDTILRNTSTGETEIHWIECNGRWGGVSIPMWVARKMLGDEAHGGMVVVQEQLDQDSTASTAQILAVFGDLLFVRGQNSAGVILMSPKERAGGITNFVAIAPSQTQAEEIAGTAIARLRNEHSA